MNPPSALHGALSRDRKPFTYTPGGLDLSEIKSSRMAARLMRNAMNEGVPELPKNVQSSSMSSTPIAVPNFNCLPVQVFPAFNLPANPKSLLRSRSNPVQQKELPYTERVNPPQSQLVHNSRAPGATQYDTFNKNTPTYSQINNNRPVSMFEYGSPASTFILKSYVSDTTFPEISYDAEYLRMPPKTNSNSANTMPFAENVNSSSNVNNHTIPNTRNQGSEIPFDVTSQYTSSLDNVFKPDTDKNETVSPFNESSIYQDYLNSAFKSDIESMENNSPLNVTDENQIKPNSYCNSDIDKTEIVLSPIDKNQNHENGEYHNPMVNNKENHTTYTEFFNNENNSETMMKPESENKVQILQCDNDDENAKNNLESADESKEVVLDIFAKPTTEYSTFAAEYERKPNEDLTGPTNQKKEVRIVKKQVIDKENKVEDHNGSDYQNGEGEVDTTSVSPTQKSAAKSTKIEVTKRTLPDGSIEEVKKTITKTTVDGKTEIRTKTETTIIPKDNDEDEFEEVEEEEEDEGEIVDVASQEENKQKVVLKNPEVDVVKSSNEETVKSKENGHDNVIKTEERSESTTTTSKKIIVVQDDQDEHNKDETVEEDEELEEAEPVTFVIKQPAKTVETPKEEVTDETKEEEEIESDVVKEQEIQVEKKVENVKKEVEQSEKDDEIEEDEVEEEEEYEEAEEKEPVEKVETGSETVLKSTDVQLSKNLDQVNPDDKEQTEESPTEEIKTSLDTKTSEVEDDKHEQTQEVTEEKQEVVVEKEELKREKQDVIEEKLSPREENPETPQAKVPLREPSVPLEKVEDVEIKPIGLGDFLTKTHTENTEIITNVTEKPTGLLTEINRIENIVTVNRTTKTLDHAYENITQQGIPTVKTYFTPHIEKISATTPARPYQPVYPPEPITERRHSLLLERLSVERQIPSDIYQNTNNQYSNQTVDQQRQWSQEPQAEVLTVSNVKPSQITNQQWYQQRENAIYNNITPSAQPAQTAPPSWSQTQPQPTYQPQPQYQPPPQPQYQASPQIQPQPQYQAPIQPQQQPQYQPTYTENIQENTSKSYQNTYSTYTPKPTNWASNNTMPISPIPTIITPSQPSQYNYLSKDSSESYQKTTQNYSSSSYVPPPWEQDSTYVAPDVSSQNYYQPPPPTNSFSPAPSQGWKPNLPASKFNKTPPTAYIPPKPNQSFVAPVTAEPPKMPGRKTYYSEYERRYISVPESTYIPGESKFQPQPDPSPAYYYDNNEPTETVEPQWRRELREFTEKSQSQTTTETNIKPPWEAETKYAKAPEPSYTPTPTWTQTVRPQSWRERSFESEFVSQEWPKTNTLGRGRPLSSYGKETIPERTRGVSVDRYNPNSYQAPVAAEHPPVQTHTHIPPAPHATGYHNPNVPAYHARASAEPREQVSYQQPRNYREARASPFQSRSFKYLQWITGTED